MGQTIRTVFKSESWEERELGQEGVQPRLTQASCRQVYRGDIEGTSVLEYLMVYEDGGAASFVGMERIEGTVAGRSGSFALQHIGTFREGKARMTLEIVEGAGTGALAGLRGSGTFESAHAAEYEVVLECEFVDP